MTKWNLRAGRLLSLLLAAALLVGCTGAATGTKAAAESAATIPAATEAAEDGTLVVQVTAIDGSTITAATGARAALSPGQGSPDGQQAPDGSGGTTPEGTPPALPENGAGGGPGNGQQPPDGSGGTAPEGTLPALPENGADGANPPSGGPGENGQGGVPPELFTADGGTVTFLLTDATVITRAGANGESEAATAADIAVNAILTVVLNSDNTAASVTVQRFGPDGMPGGGFGGSATVTNGTAATTLTSDGDVDGATYTSTGDDENALRIDGATVSLTNITAEKSGGASSNTENGDFYGQNAAILATNGATVTIDNATVTTNAVNGNGVFSYGEGTTVAISNSVIQTTGRNSGGLQTTGGGATTATNLTVETQGDSAAAIRSDRGGGTVTVDGGVYTTNGTGSPAIYSTADISVTNATLTATRSEAVVIEGKNSVALTDCTATGAMSGTYGNESGENLHAIMIYQSMSGDAAVGDATFSATGGSITAKNGDMFYVTNTGCTITLDNVAFTMADGLFLRVSGNDGARGWGTAGTNGGTCVLSATDQVIAGDIAVDEISLLTMTLSGSAAFTGAINQDDAGGTANVALDGAATWTLTADSYVTSFMGSASQLNLNGHTLYVNGTAYAA